MLLRSAAALAALLAGLGVALAAAGAHVPGGGLLATAATILLAEAPLLLAGAAAVKARLIGGRIVGVGLAAGALGALLFAGDLTARVFLGDRLFPQAAPSGGTLMILGWLAVALGSLAYRPGGEA
jgi:uncharacterized membrane protein YgdD (TMEM256/DUF423 family)